MCQAIYSVLYAGVGQYKTPVFFELISKEELPFFPGRKYMSSQAAAQVSTNRQVKP